MSSIPAFRPGTYLADLQLLFPISPTRPGPDEKQRQDENLRRLRWWGKVRGVKHG